jgi:RimJ/RimL family protein N-acetyltransferase
MISLEKSKFHLIQPLLEERFYQHTFSFGVIEGTFDGNIYVNNTEEPKAALIEVFNGIHHLFGETTDEDFNHSLLSRLQEKAKGSEKPFVIFTEPTWDEEISKWNLNDFEQVHRTAFNFDPAEYAKKEKISIPVDFSIRQKDEALVHQSKEYNERYYELYWGSLDNFFQNGLGICLLNKDQAIVSEATVTSCGKFAEVDIITDPNHRGKGFGKVIAQQFITDSLTKKRVPKWDCFSENLASIKMADSLGFVQKGEYPVYVCR